MLGWFRRHATILMVVLGSGAMVIFGLGPVFDRLSQTGPGRTFENRTLASWKGGEVKERDLQVLTQRHFEVQRLIGKVMEQAQARMDNYRPLAPPLPPINEQNDPDSQMLDRILLAEKAKQEGFIASDTLVENYIGLLSADAGFTESDLEAMNREVNRSPLMVVKEQMKTELLYVQMFNYLEGQATIRPNVTEAMQLYRRTNEQIECQVVPVEVEPFLAQVKDEPSSSEIKRLYEEGKEEYPTGDGEEPGFRVGRKVNVQYLMANFETFLQNEMNKLTDAEVQAEYDRLVAEENFLVMEPATEDNALEISDPPPALPGEGGGNQPDDGDQADAPGDVDAPPGEGGDAEMEKQTAGQPGENKTESGAGEANQNTEGQTENSETQKDPESSAEGQEKPAEKQSESSNQEGSKTEGSTEQNTEAGEGTESGEGEATGNEGGENEGGEGGQQSSVDSLTGFQFVSTGSQENEGQSEPALDKPAESNQQDAGDTSSDQDTDQPGPPPGDQESDPGALDLQLEDMQDSTPKQKVKPLKDVVGQIKRQMALTPAREAMEKAVIQANVEVNNYYSGLLDWEYNKEGEKPGPLDYKDVANRYNLEDGETGLVDINELSEDPFGSARFQQGLAAVVVFSAFDKAELYSPIDSQGGLLTPNRYIYWFTEKVDSKVPTLAECKDDIIKFWRTQKARELAMAEAKSMAEKLNGQEGKTLKDLFAERAVETGAFTWFNGQFGGISQPFGVENAGDDFMEAAFALDKGNAGVAFNASNETAYVIQSQTGTRPFNEIAEEFLDDQLVRFERIPDAVTQASRYYHSRVTSEVMKDVREDLKLRRYDQ